MFHGIKIIGLAGGIGSGKSYIAALFAELGCAVIDSDAAVRAIYERPDVQETLRTWWGADVVSPFGAVDRSAIARRVFNDPQERERLERLLHPLVNQLRVKAMHEKITQTPDIKAFIWDTPLLFESGLYKQCDALVFIDTPLEIRIKRVAGRGWTAEELARREKSQWPLDKKRLLCNDVIVNSGNGADARGQVGQVLTRILAR